MTKEYARGSVLKVEGKGLVVHTIDDILDITVVLWWKDESTRVLQVEAVSRSVPHLGVVIRCEVICRSILDLSIYRSFPHYDSRVERKNGIVDARCIQVSNIYGAEEGIHIDELGYRIQTYDRHN